MRTELKNYDLTKTLFQRQHNKKVLQHYHLTNTSARAHHVVWCYVSPHSPLRMEKMIERLHIMATRVQPILFHKLWKKKDQIRHKFQTAVVAYGVFSFLSTSTLCEVPLKHLQSNNANKLFEKKNSSISYNRNSYSMQPNSSYMQKAWEWEDTFSFDFVATWRRQRTNKIRNICRQSRLHWRQNGIWCWKKLFGFSSASRLKVTVWCNRVQNYFQTPPQDNFACPNN